MTATDDDSVVVHAPRGRDAALVVEMCVSHGIPATRCDGAGAFVDTIRSGVGCAVITSEALDRGLQAALAATLAGQPAWSDCPFVVLTRAVSPARELAFDLGNMTLLERPVAPTTLLVAITAALRGRRRQYAARAAIDQRDRFLAMLGHELRNPLAAISLASDPVMPNQDATVLPKRLAIISRQAHRLNGLVNDLLDVARVTTGKVQLRREAVDVDATVRECVEALGPRARARGVNVAVTRASGATIEGDTGRVAQVISNLVVNAIKYSPAGRAVTVSAHRVGDWCELRVRDHGIGIAPDILPRVFELFSQADATLDRSEGGMGIGLALVDQLVRLHGGTVSAASDGLDKGSEFVVRLPVGHPPASPTTAIVSQTRGARALRVAIVEDNPDVLELTREAVAALGCETFTAADGEQGLECILDTRPDLALIDVGLPALDGYAVASLVRQRLAPPPILVAITGYGQRSDRERALASGFDEHLVKPIRPQMLRLLVDTARVRTLTVQRAS
jgi:signal transduction histidine kinase/ActR/RegA family two-component response regulator